MAPKSYTAFLSDVLTTPRGWALIILGHAFGLVFAAVVFSISVISFPLLLDRDVGAACAVQTSLRAVMANPRTMLIWAAIIAGLTMLGSAPLLVGLAVIMPILGHASWHLYRRTVEPSDETNPAPQPYSPTSPTELGLPEFRITIATVGQARLSWERSSARRKSDLSDLRICCRARAGPSSAHRVRGGTSPEEAHPSSLIRRRSLPRTLIPGRHLLRRNSGLPQGYRI